MKVPRHMTRKATAISNVSRSSLVAGKGLQQEANAESNKSSRGSSVVPPSIGTTVSGEPAITLEEEVAATIQPLPTTNLERGEVVEEEIQPGAYACSATTIGGVRPNNNTTGVRWNIFRRPPSSNDHGTGVDCDDLSSTSDTDGISMASARTSTSQIYVQDEELALAKPVEEELEEDLPRAEHYGQEERIGDGKRSLVMALCLWIFAVVIGTGLPLGLCTSTPVNSTDRASLPPMATHGSHTTHVPYPLSLFPESTVHAVEKDDSSPQFRAYQWLLDDPSLESYSTERLLQRFALATFFFSTGGPTHWIDTDNWLSYEDHECDWYTQRYYGHNATTTDGKVHTYEKASEGKCNSNGMFQHLWLYINGLEGPIPEELFWLSNLKSIDLSNNYKISGTISTQVGKLQELELLIVARNSLSGELPTEIGLLSNTLRLLMTYNNHAHTASTIPTEIGRLEQLEYFLASGFVGTLPSQLGQLSKMEWLQLWSCDETTRWLTGTIPTQLGLLTSLTELHFDGNSLTGPIPSQLGMLEHLAMLSLEKNQELSGTLPSQLGQLQRMQKLWLYRNNLVGSIPSQVGLFHQLNELKLSFNPLVTGSIPPLINNKLEVLDVSNTAIIGTIPSTLCHLNSSHLLFNCNPSLLCGCSCSCSFPDNGNDDFDLP